MKALQTRELLDAWEQGLNQPLLQRVLIILSVAYPEINTDTLLKLSIGQRDRLLFQLRDRLFGQQLLNTAVCPNCEQRIEWENEVVDFAIQPNEESIIDNEYDLEADGYNLRFRLPNSLDLDAIEDLKNTDKAQQQLLSRCLIEAKQAGKNCDSNKLPDSVIKMLKQEIEQLDTQADICIQLNCPDCSHNWKVLFDIASFLWVEINDWAQKMLQIVNKLAIGYGWSEQEILQLSPVRRQLYLGMLSR